MSKRISEMTYVGSGSISPTSLIEIVQNGNNFSTTPKDFVQSAIPINIDAFPTGSAPVITTASNLGTGLGIYGQKVGNDLQFKGLVAGNNITLSSSSTEILINAAPDSGSAITLKNFVLNEDMLQGDLSVIMNNGNVRKIQYSAFGDEYIFRENYSTFPEVLSTDTNKFIIATAESVGSGYNFNICLMVGNANGSSLSFGSASIIPLVYGGYKSITILDSSRFVITYGPVNSSTVVARIGSIEGASINLGSEYILHSGSFGAPAYISSLDSSRFVLMCTDTNNTQIFFKLCTVNGTSITYGSQSVGISGSRYIANGLHAFSASSFAFTYRDRDSNYDGYINIGSVSGDIFSFGTSALFEDADIGNTDRHITNMATLNSSKLLLSYVDTSDNSVLSRVVDITGPTTFLLRGINTAASSNATGDYIGTCTFSDTKFSIIYSIDNSYHSFMKIGTVSGASISFSDSFIFNVSQVARSTEYIAATKINSVGMVIIFDDLGNLNYSTAIYAVNDPYLITDRISGILQITGSASQSKPVAVFGETSTIHSGLTPGNLYYYDVANKNGVLKTDTGYLAGVALSTTEIKIVSY